MPNLTPKSQRIGSDIWYQDLPDWNDPYIQSILNNRTGAQKILDKLGQFGEESGITPIVEEFVQDNFLTDSGSIDFSPLTDAFKGWFDNLQTSADKANEIAQANAVAANQFAHEEAELLRQWQENMSNTAYQRAYSDMKAAGINPIIGFGAGASPASTPGGAAATATGAQTFKRDHNVADDVIAIAQIFATLVSSVTGAFK